MGSEPKRTRASCDNSRNMGMKGLTKLVERVTNVTRITKLTERIGDGRH